MFYFDSETLRAFADECVQQLDADTIEYFKHHLAYHHHHFEYGMFIRNKFGPRLPDSAFFCRDRLSSEIYAYILAKLFPELGDDMNSILLLSDSNLFSEICAHYHLRNGIMPFCKFPVPDNRFPTLDDTDEDFYAQIEQWHTAWANHLDEYALAVADSLWDVDAFRQYVVRMGLDASIATQAYETCKTILLEKHFFLPIELACYLHKELLTADVECNLHRHMKFFFTEHCSDAIVLPAYVFAQRDFVKSAVSYNGHCLAYAPKFHGDYEIVKIAVQNDPESIQYASTTLKNHADIIETAVTNSKDCLILNVPCMKKYKDDDRLVKLALKANGANICYASKRIRDDYEMARYALRHQRDLYPCSAYPALSARLRDDLSLAMIELNSERPCVESFSKRLRNNDEIAAVLYENKNLRWLLTYMSKRIQKKYPCDCEKEPLS